MEESPDFPKRKSGYLQQNLKRYFQKNSETPESTESVTDGFNNKPSMMKNAGVHLSFECNGISFVYAYIRKNACSTFKDFIHATSPHLNHCEPDGDKLRFLRTHHEIRNADEFSAASVRIFVYRNPIQRATSLFKNKFVMSTGNADVFHDYERVTGKNPFEATFSNFVNDYLASGICALDPHCRTQHSHLLPMRYTHAVRMGDLQNEIAKLIGTKLSKKYFAHQVNSSNAESCSKDSANISAAELHKAYVDDKHIPTSDALLTLDLTRTLRRLYRDDFRMISHIQGARPSR